MICLREGVNVDPGLLDGSMVLGSGFAPFRGSPLHHACKPGFEDLVSTLDRFAGKYGERLQPESGWQGPKVVDFLSKER